MKLILIIISLFVFFIITYFLFRSIKNVLKSIIYFILPYEVSIFDTKKFDIHFSHSIKFVLWLLLLSLELFLILSIW
jgi:hypothetical protein